ncbi:50S ribosomal protein L10 [Rickettsiales bacterium LUAb2]
MLKAKKIELVAELKEVFNNHSSVMVFHYKGLDVDKMEELRSKIYDTKSGFKVIKNKLAAIASKDTACETIQDIFVGPTALAWSNDPVALPKILVDFAKTNTNLQLIGGVYGNKKLSVEDIKSLASLPSMDELRAKVIAIIQTPATKVAGVLQRPASMVAAVLGAYSKK